LVQSEANEAELLRKSARRLVILASKDALDACNPTCLSHASVITIKKERVGCCLAPCVLLQLLHVYSRKMSRLPELIRQQRKRALGQPRTGRMSLVMTDIQGFTGLMQEAPDHTTQVREGGGIKRIKEGGEGKREGEGRGGRETGGMQWVFTPMRVFERVCKAAEQCVGVRHRYNARGVSIRTLVGRSGRGVQETGRSCVCVCPFVCEALIARP